jgi:WXG100 family type VII secretion target
MAFPAGASGAALSTDFDLMLAVSGTTDTRNDEIRAMLQSFIAEMSSVPATVWGGAAAARFREVVDRWNTESLRLHAALQRIAETIRDNAQTLRTATDTHSQAIGSVAGGL